MHVTKHEFLNVTSTWRHLWTAGRGGCLVAAQSFHLASESLNHQGHHQTRPYPGDPLSWLACPGRVLAACQSHHLRGHPQTSARPAQPDRGQRRMAGGHTRTTGGHAVMMICMRQSELSHQCRSTPCRGNAITGEWAQQAPGWRTVSLPRRHNANAV